MNEIDIKKIANTLKTQIDKMPKELREAIYEISWEKTFNSIKEELKLTQEETENLSLEIFMFLFGVTNPLDISLNIQNTLKENKEKNQEVEKTIKEKVIIPIYEIAKQKGYKGLSEEEIKELKEGLEKTPKEENLELEDFLLFEAYTEAPEKIKDIFRSGELVQKIENIGQKFNLTNEEKSTVEAVLTIGFLSKIENQKIYQNLKEKLESQKEKIEEIFKEIEKEIILPLVKSLNEGVKKFEEKINQTQSINKDVRLPEELKKRFYDLPEDLRWAIGEITVEEKMLELKQKYNLNIEQAGFVSSLIYSILVGHTHIEKFEDGLRMVVKTTPENINEILNYINQNIFRGVREKILSLHKEKDKKAIFIEEENIKKEIPQNDSIVALKKLIEKEKTETKNTEESSDQKNINLANSIFAQKLSGNFRIPKTETEHKTTQNTQGISSIKKIDPYREIPE